ncbi:MAG: glycosyltransferase [Planctomycetaceae bacterium]
MAALPRRILLVVPHPLEDPRGNSRAALRLIRLLEARGVAVEVWNPFVHGAPPGNGRPDLVHAFHLRKGGPPAVEVAARLGVPLVLSARGTDIDHDGAAPAVRHAALVLVLTEAQREDLLRHYPGTATELVPQGVEECRGERHEEGELVVQVAGLRKVKGMLESLPALDRVAARRPEFRFELAGPSLEADYAGSYLRELGHRPWARFLGEIEPREVPRLYARARIALNTSVAEGLSNAVLEAFACGCPVVACDVPGNRAVVEEGVTGLLYGDLAACIERLLDDRALASRLAGAARRRVRERFGPGHEAEAYVRAYGRVIGAGA